MSGRRVGFLHPDLGIGGAERLIVDAAVALQNHGNQVVVYTSHCSPTHSFRETQDGTLQVKVIGDWLPTTLFGRFKALFAYFRMIYVAIWMLCTDSFDVVVLDQVSLPMPFFRLAGVKTLFYCHYPDKLLTNRSNFFKWLYRWPLDTLEGWTTGLADEVLVNSQFTAGIFQEAFPTIKRNPRVLYPAINFDAMKRGVNAEEVLEDNSHYLDKDIFLSINRFERKKNLPLAVEAFSVLKTILPEGEFDQLHLVMAGGYDPQLPENREVFNQLKTLVSNEGLSEHVTFMPSFSEPEKEALLTACFAVVYTPSNEHFGIVPVEGMYFEKPVIAVNSGGPMESIVHEQTGLLCEPKSSAFSAAMSALLKNKSKSQQMGKQGKERTIRMFSLEQFGRELNSIITSLAPRR